MTGTDASVRGGAVTLDPQACNSLVQTAGGLLVPRAMVAGIAPGTAVSTARSVDIDVTPPAAGACPATWTVGARLTPPSGFKNAEGGNINLLAQVGTTLPVPGTDIVLPEVGVYHIDTDVRYALGTATGGSGYIVGHLRDATTGGLLTSFTQIAAINAPSAQEHQGGTTHLMAEYRVTTAPRTIRLDLLLVRSGGTLSEGAAGGTDSNGATRMRFLKVRD